MPVIPAKAGIHCANGEERGRHYFSRGSNGPGFRRSDRRESRRYAAAFSPPAARRASRIISAAVPFRRFAGVLPVADDDDLLVGADLGERAFAR